MFAFLSKSNKKLRVFFTLAQRICQPENKEIHLFFKLFMQSIIRIKEVD